MPEPAMMSLTMPETSTSFGSAAAAMRADVDCDPADASVSVLDLAGMRAGPNLETQCPDGTDDRRCATHRAAR
jgi:hypothetical protein